MSDRMELRQFRFARTSFTRDERALRGWDRAIAVHDVVVDIFRADVLDETAWGAVVHDDSRPWHVERARIFDREIDAHHFALVCAIDRVVIAAEATRAARLARHGLLDHVVALDDMQRFGVRRAIAVERREMRNRNADRVDDKRVTLIMADGVTVPGGRDLNWMGGVQTGVTNLRAMRVHQHDLILLLQDVQLLIAENIRRWLGPALIMSSGERIAGLGDFAV